jgi:hypothetical protein
MTSNEMMSPTNECAYPGAGFALIFNGIYFVGCGGLSGWLYQVSRPGRSSRIIPAMIYNDLYRYKGALNFPALEMYHRRSSFPIRLDDEVGRGLKHHGEMKWLKSPSAD